MMKLDDLLDAVAEEAYWSNSAVSPGELLNRKLGEEIDMRIEAIAKERAEALAKRQAEHEEREARALSWT